MFNSVGMGKTICFYVKIGQKHMVSTYVSEPT